jgi:ABC-type Fe3+/spermidine/putrescine transport system ATPase subunit
VALDAGEVFLRGERVTTLPPHRRRVGMVFQHYALFPHRTVAQNVAFGLRMRRVPKPEIARRVGEALKLVQLPGYGDRYPRQLSGGEQQRVALARALVTQPAVLLLDEPLGALDKKLRERMQVELKRLQREVGVTTIYVTHDQEEALTMSDRIAVMRAGRIEQLGAPVDIYERPASAFVADFIGHTNLVRGRVREHVGPVALVECGGALVKAAAAGSGDAAGREVTVVLRPEKVRLDPAESVDTELLTTVTHVVYLGETVLYHLRAEGGLDLTARELAEAATVRYAVGTRVRAGWRAEHAALLPARGEATP